MTKATLPILDEKNFLLSMRNAGYLTPTNAIAELVDNSIESNATKIEIFIENHNDQGETVFFAIADNGSGMTKVELTRALTFGGSSRHNSRNGLGRFGVGLPASSLSQSRCVEIYSWHKAGPGWSVRLDLDDIIAGSTSGIQGPSVVSKSEVLGILRPVNGTIVAWPRCDRINGVSLKTLIKKLTIDLGRMYRRSISAGIQIWINGKRIEQVDPLFIQRNSEERASQYGPTMEINVSQILTHRKLRDSTVKIRWSELPIEKWHCLKNVEKKKLQTISQTGLHILRAGREIDHGWYFMGNKRRENYDAWWRAELDFSPELDELFGVTTLKQGIRPRQDLVAMLTPHIEAAAYVLYGRVRARFALLSENYSKTAATRQAESKDAYLSPIPAQRGVASRPTYDPKGNSNVTASRAWAMGLRYAFEMKSLETQEAFIPSFHAGLLNVTLNADHPLVAITCETQNNKPSHQILNVKSVVELFLLAYSRAELSLRGKEAKSQAQFMRKKWSDNLHVLLS